MDTVGLAWLAGLFDGEGCIGLYHNKREHKGWNYFVCISNTNPAIISKAKELITEICFGKPPYIRYDKSRGSRANCFAIMIQAKPLIHKFLLTISPYLVGKLEQAMLMMDALTDCTKRPEIAKRLVELKQERHDNSEETLKELRS